MKIYTFNGNTAEITKRFTKKQAWIHKPVNERDYKKEPYFEVYLEDTPKKNHITAVRVSFKQIKELLKK